MKYITLTLLILISICIHVQAQTGTGRISGSIKDTVTGTTMESATVIVYKPDSTVVQFKITDKNGRYEITGLPMQGKYVLAVSFAGYKDYRLPFTMDVPVKKSASKKKNKIGTPVAPVVGCYLARAPALALWHRVALPPLPFFELCLAVPLGTARAHPRPRVATRPRAAALALAL